MKRFLINPNGTSSTYPVASPGAYRFVDDFDSGSASDGNVGRNNWRFYAPAGNSASCAFQAGSGVSWGIFRLQTSTSSSDAVNILLYPQSTSPLDDISTTVFDSYFRFAIGTVTSVVAVVGLVANPSGAEESAHRYALRFNTGTDTNIQFLTTAGGGTTTTDLGVPPVAGTYYTLRIWSDVAGTIYARLYTAAGAATGNLATHTTNLSASAMSPMFYVRTLTAAARSLDCDYCGIEATLAR